MSQSVFHGSEEGEEFDEESVERDAFEIEQLVEDFVEEPPFRHNQIPENESDSSNEDDEAPNKPKMRNPVKRSNGCLYKDHNFFNGVAFKDYVLDYALKTGRNIKQYRYDKDKIEFKCVGGVNVVEGNEGESSHCEWKVYASRLPRDNVWKVKLFIDKHSCVPNGTCEMLKVPHIARLPSEWAY